MTAMIFHEAIARAVSEGRGAADKLLKDIEAIKEGSAPKEADLSLAPMLDHWVPLISNGGARIALAGRVEGHPVRRNGLIVTTTLCAIEAKTFTWARTQTRWYRLGRYFGRFKMMAGLDDRL